MIKIPYHLHQTWKSFDDLKEKGGIFNHNLKSWFEGNPGLEYSFYSDGEMDAFVRENFPEYYPCFCSLDLIIEKADFFRYLVLYHHGGIYSDVDTYCLTPIKKWVGSEYKAVLCLETDVIDLSLKFNPYTRDCTVCQWTMAFAPKHPLLKLIIEKLVDRVKHWPRDMSDFSFRADGYPTFLKTIERTGPGLVTDAVVEWLDLGEGNSKELFPGGSFGDLIILPPHTFGHCIANTVKGRDFTIPPHALVAHQFLGTWLIKKRVNYISTHDPLIKKVSSCMRKLKVSN